MKSMVFLTVTPDSSMDTGFYGFEGSRDDRIDKKKLEPTDTIIGKLQLHCPTFFNSLSVMERQIVSSSIWLKNSISKSAQSPLVDSECPSKIRPSPRGQIFLIHSVVCYFTLGTSDSFW
jgi:hypothetical protein